MADVTNLAVGGTTVGANYLKHTISTSDAGTTLIVKISKTNITDAELNTIIQYMTLSHGVNGNGDSAFTVAGVATANGAVFQSGVTDVVFLKIQGTGDYTVDASDAHGVTGAATEIVAIFKPAK
jgi:hypothetical protein